jgi:hypothetical protein
VLLGRHDLDRFVDSVVTDRPQAYDRKSHDLYEMVVGYLNSPGWRRS